MRDDNAQPTPMVPLPNHPLALSTVPAGWVWAVNVITAALTNTVPGFRVVQIKPKFGALRYYYQLPEGLAEEVIREVAEMVQAVQEATSTRCEICGQEGRLRDDNPHWWRTLCDQHEGSMDEVDVPLRVRERRRR